MVMENTKNRSPAVKFCLFYNSLPNFSHRKSFFFIRFKVARLGTLAPNWATFAMKTFYKHLRRKLAVGATNKIIPNLATFCLH